MRSFPLVFAFLICQSAWSQNGPQVETTKDHKISRNTIVSFKAGYNHSDISGVELDGDKTGYMGGELYAGFSIEGAISSKWFIEGELLFSWTDDYHFIEIPLHAKMKLAKKWKAFLGPKFDFVADKFSSEEDPFHEFKTVGISADLGIQFDITNWLYAETRYSKGFTEQITDYFLDIYEGKRHTFRVGVGIKF